MIDHILQILKDNPDLDYAFVVEILRAKHEADNSKLSPYVRKTSRV